jgi:hypothetical protein
MRDAGSFWFKASAVDPDAAFRCSDNAQDQWQKAYEAWSEHGLATGMTMTFDERAALESRARVVPERDDFAVMPLEQMVAMYGFPLEAAEARQALLNLEKNRSVTNFEFFLEQARAQASPEAVMANKLIADAKRYEAVGNYPEAADRYARGLAQWRRVFELYEKFHRTERSDQTESDAYELVMNLAALVLKDRTQRESQAKAQAEAAAVGFIGGPAARVPGDLDRMAAPAPQWAFAAACGGAAAVAGAGDIARALAEEEALARIVAYEPATQAAARDVTQFGLAAVASGLARGVEALDPPDLAARKAATLAVDSRLFGGEFAYRMLYKQDPEKHGKSEMLRWSRSYVEDEVKGRLGLAKKLPPEVIPGPDETPEPRVSRQ